MIPLIPWERISGKTVWYGSRHYKNGSRADTAAALQESFGNEALSGMQGREARRVYKKACSYVYGGLPWYKKIYFRYGKVYR